MKVAEAIRKLKIDINTLDVLIKESKGGQFLIRQREKAVRELILNVYETVEPESEILVADIDILITLN
jgi:hypothetical protein